MHFMNPVPLMVLVEIIRGQATSDETTKTIMDLSRALGKTPVEVNDFPGFVSNRVLMPMINEAVYAVFEGVATPQAVDEVMKLGMNHPMGPFPGRLHRPRRLPGHPQRAHDGPGDPKYVPAPLKRMVDGLAGRHMARFHLRLTGAHQDRRRPLLAH
jgi:3-hydroxybutyryl-CoA dehydrogenase